MIPYLTFQSGYQYDLNSLYSTLASITSFEKLKETYTQLHVLYKNTEGLGFTALERRKIEICYDLYNGHGFRHSKDIGRHALKDMPWNLPQNIKMRHVPIIGPIAAHRVGERAARATKFTIVDTSGYTTNLIKNKLNEKIASWISNTIINPAIQKFYLEELQANGIQDPLSLDLEQRQQLLSQAEEKAHEELPENLFDRLGKEYTSALEERGARFADFLLQQYSIPFLFKEGYKSAMISGGQVYKWGMNFDKPYIEQKNILNFKPYLKPDKVFFSDAEACIYTDSISPVEYYLLYYPFLTRDNKNTMNKVNIPTLGSLPEIANMEYKGSVMSDGNTLNSVYNNPFTTLNNLSPNSNFFLKRGQGLVGIERVHSQIRGFRRLKEVLNINPKTGEAIVYYTDDAYTLQPQIGDVSFEYTRTDEIFETTELAGKVYTEQRRVPFQYTSILHPSSRVKMQYEGAYLSRLQGNTENTSPMMKAVELQFCYDMHNSLIDKDIANNIGKVLMIFTNLLGDMGPEAFAKSMKSHKILPLNADNLKLDPQLMDKIRVLDLSTLSDIVERRNHMQQIRSDAVTTMNYNLDRLGYPSPYKNTANMENSIEMSNAQTLDEEILQDKIEENVLQGFMDFALQVYQRHPLNTRYSMEDGDKISLELSSMDIREMAEAAYTIKVKNTPDNFQDLNLTKQDLILQNRVEPGFLEPDELVEIRKTKSIARVLNIARRAKKRREDRAQAEQQQQMQLQQLMQQALDAREDRKQQHESDLLAARLETERYKADQTSDALNRGFDVDQDGIDNASEAASITAKSKERMHAIDSAIAMATLKLKEKEINLKAKQPKSK